MIVIDSNTSTNTAVAIPYLESASEDAIVWSCYYCNYLLSSIWFYQPFFNERIFIESDLM